jgi:hypothetical protein
MNQWLTKPCGKATITKVVEEARRSLLGIEAEDDLLYIKRPEEPRRHTA